MSEPTKQRLLDTLTAIEFIAAHQEDFEENLNTKKEKQLHSAIMKIFKMAHVSRIPGCFDKHEDWEEELQEMIKVSKS